MNPTTGTFNQIITGLQDGIIELQSGSVAFLTRQAYANLYSSYLPSPDQFYATVNVNISTFSLEILNTDEITFNAVDIISQGDWFVVNQQLLS